MISIKFNNEIALKLYYDDYSDREIASVFGLDSSTICRWREKNNLKSKFCFPMKRRETIRYLKPKICVVCKKLFKPNAFRQKYCHNPCRYTQEQVNKMRIHFSIKYMRSYYAKLVRNNPLEAKKIKEEMEEKEGKKFTDLALDGIFENVSQEKESIKNKKILENWNKKLKQG